MRKTLVICLVALLALGLMGFGFAKWSDSVTIAGSVETGTVKVGILNTGVLDQGADPQQPPGNNAEGKDVAKTTSENAGNVKFTLGNTAYYGQINETITNAYPYYKTGTTVAIANGGTIPVKIESFNVVWNDPNGIVAHMQCAGWTASDNGTVVRQGNTWDGLYQFLNRYQLHPEHVLTIRADTYFDQGTPQGASASGTITVTASQWNEVP